MKSILIYLEENEKTPLSSDERSKIIEKFGKTGCSFAKNKQGKYFCYTHRARSKYYDSIDDIPKSSVDFISSTG